MVWLFLPLSDVVGPTLSGGFQPRDRYRGRDSDAGNRSFTSRRNQSSSSSRPYRSSDRDASGNWRKIGYTQQEGDASIYLFDLQSLLDFVIFLPCLQPSWNPCFQFLLLSNTSVLFWEDLLSSEWCKLSMRLVQHFPPAHIVCVFLPIFPHSLSFCVLFSFLFAFSLLQISSVLSSSLFCSSPCPPPPPTPHPNLSWS